MELLTHGGEHHEIGDGGRLMMTMAWNWWWRKVDDDDGDGFPSSERRTDSRSALPRKIRAWRQLRIIKRDESFSLIFFSPWKWIYGVGVEVGGVPGGPRGRGHAPGGRPAPSWTRCGTLDVDSFGSIFYYFQNVSSWILRSFQELLCKHKNNIMAILLKTA